MDWSSKHSDSYVSSLWRHNGNDGVSNHQPHDCLLNCLFRRRSKKTSKLRVTGLCAGNSLGTGEFPAQMTSDAENVSIWWHHMYDAVGEVHMHILFIEYNTFWNISGISITSYCTLWHLPSFRKRAPSERDRITHLKKKNFFFTDIDYTYKLAKYMMHIILHMLLCFIVCCGLVQVNFIHILQGYIAGLRAINASEAILKNKGT